MRGGCVDIHASSNTTGGGSRPNCCLPLDARRRMLYLLLPRRQLEDAVDLSAASPWMRGGGRPTCCVAAKMPQSLYLLPRRGCEAADALPAAVTTTGDGSSRPTCRKRSSAAAVALPAASPWMRGGCCRLQVLFMNLHFLLFLCRLCCVVHFLLRESLFYQCFYRHHTF